MRRQITRCMYITITVSCQANLCMCATTEYFYERIFSVKHPYLCNFIYMKNIQPATYSTWLHCDQQCLRGETNNLKKDCLICHHRSKYPLKQTFQNCFSAE